MDTDTGLGKESAGRGLARRFWKPLTASVVVGLVVAGLGYYSLSGERDGRRTGEELRAQLPGPVEQKLIGDLSAAIAASLDKAIECGKWGPWEQFVNKAMEAINMMKSGTWTADQAIAHISKYSKYFFPFILTFLTASSIAGDAQAAQAPEIGYCKPVEIATEEDCNRAMRRYKGAVEELAWLKKQRDLQARKKLCTRKEMRKMNRRIEKLEWDAKSFSLALTTKCRAIMGDPYDGLRLEPGTPTPEEKERMKGILEKADEWSWWGAEGKWKLRCTDDCKDADTSGEDIPGGGAPIVGGFEGFEGLTGEGTPSDKDTSEEDASGEGACSLPCDPPVSCTVDLSKVNQPSPPVTVYNYNYDGDDPAAEAAAKAAAEEASCGSPSVCSTSLDEYCDGGTDPVTGEPIDRGGVEVQLCGSGGICYEVPNPDGSKRIEGGTPVHCECTPDEEDFCRAAFGGASPMPVGFPSPAPSGGYGGGGGGVVPPSGGGGGMPPSGAGGMEGYEGE